MGIPAAQLTPLLLVVLSLPPLLSSRLPARKLASPAPARIEQVSHSVVSKAIPMEVAQIAGEGAFIAGTAAVMVGITLVVSTHCFQQSAAVIIM